jgi:hypothetical protein
MRKKIIFWPKTTSILNNEEGAVIIAALLILVLLTIIGIASNNISNTEVKIATHELIHQQNFYAAEGATGEALDRIDSTGFNPKGDHDWIYKADDQNEFEVFRQTMPYDSTFWDKTMVDPDAIPDESNLQDTRFVVVQRADPELDMDQPVRYHFAIYGRCAPLNRGSTTVEIGFIKPFIF